MLNLIKGIRFRFDLVRRHYNNYNLLDEHLKLTLILFFFTNINLEGRLSTVTSSKLTKLPRAI